MEEEVSESCFCSETLDIILGIVSGVLQHTCTVVLCFYVVHIGSYHHHHLQGLPPTRSLLHVPEISCFRELLVHLSAHLPPHLPLLTEALLQLGG